MKDEDLEKILNTNTFLEALEALEYIKSQIGNNKYCPYCKVWDKRGHAKDCKLKNKINQLKLAKLKEKI